MKQNTTAPVPRRSVYVRCSAANSDDWDRLLDYVRQIVNGESRAVKKWPVRIKSRW